MINRLIENGYEAFYVGGYVRDLLLNKHISDIDIVTNARPQEIAEIFSDRDINQVGKSFGVVLIDGTEIATYRKDKYFGLSDKNAEIEYADTLEEDLMRRDLTINAMAMDIDGNIIDPFNGKEDLKVGLIKFVGNPKDRIYEDPNRIIRACRFLADIDGIFEPKTFETLGKCRTLIHTIARERIRKEILKIMNIKYASLFFVTCYQIGILHGIFSSLDRCIGITQNKFHTEPIFVHSMLTGDYIDTKYPLLKLAGYLHDVGKPQAKVLDGDDYTFIEHEKIGTELVREELELNKFSNDEIDYITGLIRFHMHIYPSTKKGIRRLLNKLYDREISYNDFLRLKMADKKAKSPFVGYSIDEVRTAISKFRQVIVEDEAFSMKDMAIDGNDIMELGYEQGPIVGEILKDLLDIVMENPNKNDRDFLMEYVKNEYARNS